MPAIGIRDTSGSGSFRVPRCERLVFQITTASYGSKVIGRLAPAPKIAMVDLNANYWWFWDANG